LQNSNGIQTNKNLDFTRSNHVVLGFESNIAKNIKFKIETYYQAIDQVPVTNYSSTFSALNTGASFNPDDQADLVNKGTGTNYGAEITLERFFNKGFYFLITGSVFDSKYKGSDKIERNTAFNTKYAANALAGKEFKLGKKGSVLYANIKGTTLGGKYFTPLDFAASKQAGIAVFDDTKAFSEQQTPYFRIDVKIGYRKDFKKSSFEIAVDLQNVSNNKNIFAQGYNPYSNTISYEYQQGFFPVPMLKFTF
jgi:outer membrane receptor protein involved in Fe transport